MSFYVPWTDVSTNHLVPTALGVAAVEAISRTGRDVQLKWPNDLLAADGRKLAGMLSEGVTVGTDPLGVVVGFGCNVSWPNGRSKALPEASSLDQIGGPPVDRRKLAIALIGKFDQQLGDLFKFGPEVLQERYRARCGTLGRNVRVETTGEPIEGVAINLDPSGRLIIDVDGRSVTIEVGDVVHLFPAGEIRRS